MTRKLFIYANCQGQALRHLLPLLIGDSENIEIENLEVYRAKDGDVDPSLHFDYLRETDVFIYRPFPSGHGFYSTDDSQDGITRFLKPQCKRICFPYLYHDALWPCFPHRDAVHGAEAIDLFLQHGATESEICRLYDSGGLFFDLRRRFDVWLETFRARESKCDIKLADFIRREHVNKCLFLTQNHPSSHLIYEVARQVCDILFGTDFTPRLDARQIMDRNMGGLTGYYPVDRYCAKELDLAHCTGIEPGAAAFYKTQLVAHCRRWAALNPRRTPSRARAS